MKFRRTLGLAACAGMICLSGCHKSVTDATIRIVNDVDGAAISGATVDCRRRSGLFLSAQPKPYVAVLQRSVSSVSGDVVVKMVEGEDALVEVTAFGFERAAKDLRSWRSARDGMFIEIRLSPLNVP